MQDIHGPPLSPSYHTTLPMPVPVLVPVYAPLPPLTWFCFWSRTGRGAAAGHATLHTCVVLPPCGGAIYRSGAGRAVVVRNQD